MSQRGRFITFEGGEGAGKSTQLRLLTTCLLESGHDVRVTREPGGSPGAEDIRKLLVEGEPERWTPLAETLLFLAARADHVARIIDPALAGGAWVLCDRFADSTVVYQGAGRGLGVECVRSLQRQVGEVRPDLTFILDIDPRDGLMRTNKRGAAENRFEKFDGGFHARLRESFLQIAREEPDRCIVVDAGRAQDVVAEEIWSHVKARFA
jgi:dTMP kinase